MKWLLLISLLCFITIPYGGKSQETIELDCIAEDRPTTVFNSDLEILTQEIICFPSQLSFDGTEGLSNGTVTVDGKDTDINYCSVSVARGFLKVNGSYEKKLILKISEENMFEYSLKNGDSPTFDGDTIIIKCYNSENTQVAEYTISVVTPKLANVCILGCTSGFQEERTKAKAPKQPYSLTPIPCSK